MHRAEEPKGVGTAPLGADLRAARQRVAASKTAGRAEPRALQVSEEHIVPPIAGPHGAVAVPPGQRVNRSPMWKVHGLTATSMTKNAITSASRPFSGRSCLRRRGWPPIGAGARDRRPGPERL